MPLNSNKITFDPEVKRESFIIKNPVHDARSELNYFKRKIFKHNIVNRIT
jgi:hypothetical protein